MGNFHSKKFDDATLVKLHIYQKYLSHWLPVFANRQPDKYWNGNINVFDFFCGPGKDVSGAEGSPIIAYRECLNCSSMLEHNKAKVNLFFSDSSKAKTESLEKILDAFPVKRAFDYTISTNTFKEEFSDKYERMKGAANLLFIDQCGIKEVDVEIFRRLISLKGTDFLFFISSSFFKRFSQLTEFKNNIDASDHISGETPYSDSHRAIASLYRSMVPNGKRYFLAPFSIKKRSNIYGLIFGTGNLLGISKFMDICWKVDPERGEANYDIDEDGLPQEGDTLDLFQENDKARKVTKFQDSLRRKLLSGGFQFDREVFQYSLEEGFLPVKHAKPVLSACIKSGEVKCEGQPRLSKPCIKEPRRLMLGS